jgi:hypothetical protein
MNGVTIDRVGSVIGFIALMYLTTTCDNNTSWIDTVYISLWQATIFLILLCLHQLSDNGFQLRKFLFPWSLELSSASAIAILY